MNSMWRNQSAQYALNNIHGQARSYSGRESIVDVSYRRFGAAKDKPKKAAKKKKTTNGSDKPKAKRAVAVKVKEEFIYQRSEESSQYGGKPLIKPKQPY